MGKLVGMLLKTELPAEPHEFLVLYEKGQKGLNRWLQSAMENYLGQDGWAVLSGNKLTVTTNYTYNLAPPKPVKEDK